MLLSAQGADDPIDHEIVSIWWQLWQLGDDAAKHVAKGRRQEIAVAADLAQCDARAANSRKLENVSTD
jgi:hypothetical protein